MDEKFDLNLLTVLDALLEERSVTDAAARLNRSVPALSRSLGQIRRMFDDPILVRSGLNLVPTPRALLLQGRVHEIVEGAQQITQVGSVVDIPSTARTFTIAANDSVICRLAGPLYMMLADEAPRIKVFFVTDGPVEVSLREEVIDMQIGVVKHSAPEICIEPLILDRLVGVARREHPIFAEEVTLDAYVAAGHLRHSPRGGNWAHLDDQLAELGLARSIEASLPTLASSFVFLSQTDLISTCFERLALPFAAAFGLRYFELPLPVNRTLQFSLAWHPRFSNDLVHEWMRRRIRTIFDSFQGDDA